MATKKTSTKFDTAHNIETEADLTNKTATVKNLVTGETYQGSGGGSGLPDISAGDAGKVLAVSNELAAEWVAAPVFIVNVVEGTLDKTWAEIFAALSSGKIAIIPQANAEAKFAAPNIIEVATFDNEAVKGYRIHIFGWDGGSGYEAATENDYPTFYD